MQLLSLNEEEKEQLQKESLDSVYMDWCDKKDWEFDLEGQYLMWDCDHFWLTIKDENGNVVYETNDPKDLQDRTCDDDGKEMKGWKFRGIKDDIYLTRIQTLRGCYYYGKFELEEPFDKNKLYILKDTMIDDELMGDDVFSLDTIYYQRDKSPSIKNDAINLDDGSTIEEQYYDTYLMRVDKLNWWHDLQDKKCFFSHLSLIF